MDTALDNLNGREVDTATRTYPPLAQLIRERRTDLGLTQEELAKAVDRSYPFIYRLERGTATLSKHSTIERFAEVLGTTVDEIYVAARRITPDVEAALRRITSTHQLTQVRNTLDQIGVHE